MKKDSETELRITREVVRNLWQNIQYQNLYINLLLGVIKEDEFKIESDKFIMDKKNKVTDEELACAVSYVKALLPDTDLYDMSELLNVEYADMVRMLEIKKEDKEKDADHA